MKSRIVLVSFAIATLALAPGPLRATPGDLWLQTNNLEELDLYFDQDNDGIIGLYEYYSGTNPFVANGRMPIDIHIDSGDVVLSWDTLLGARYEIGATDDLSVSMMPLTSVAGDGNPVDVVIAPDRSSRYFQLFPLDPADTDGDGLSDLEEVLITGSNHLLADTDLDTFLDGEEVLTLLTDPLVANVGGGTIRGTVLSDPNGDGDTSDGTPVEGAKVFLDANFNGVHENGERFLITPASGLYEFILLTPGLYHVRQELPPATVQTLPAPASSANLDSWPDTLINYTHDPGGALPVPYGYEADHVWPAQRFNIIGQAIEAVDPAIVLKPVGIRPEVPPIGIYNTTEILSIPQNGSITVKFDEIIVDLDGPDFTVIRSVQGPSTELVDILVGPDEFSLTHITTMNQGIGSNVFPVDLSAFAAAPPIQVVKLVSQTNGGADVGAAIAGFQALNFVGPETGARVVTITATEIVDPVDFGRSFDDRPPTLLFTAATDVLQVSQSTSLELVTTDDIGIVSRSLIANGTPVALTPGGTGSYSPPYPGTVRFEATATDTAAQVTTESWIFYVLDAGGELPFDPNALGDLEGDTATQVQVFSPGAGTVPTADADIIATIASTTTPIWSVEYAPIADIDPNNLSAPDPDYILLNSGTSFVNSEPIGVFPASSLANGIYFLRITAQPSGGGPIKYFGQVLGIGVNEADLRPQITITAPLTGSNADLVQQITGSITSTQPLAEWYVDYAPRNEVDPFNIGSDEPNWTRIASGSTEIISAPIADLDTTVIPNDAYIIRVVAWNDLRLGRAEPIELEVANQAKLGRHHREFTDLQVDLAGFPLAIKRVYDSYAADTIGDFGHGWSLGFSDPDIRETVPQTGVSIFGATPFRDGTRIYLNSPEDPSRRIGFTFRPEFVAGTLFGSAYRVVFEPDPGVYESLEVPEGDLPFLQLSPEGDALLLLIPLPFNPDRYILTTKDGRRYTYDQGAGFVEAEDPNGNRLSYSTEEGFSHSGGQSLGFVRDGTGRIASITDPEGGTWQYLYDVDGNLSTVTNPDLEATTYGYFATPAHFLKDVTDPFGRVGTQYEYDADGRLSAIIDEKGERFEQTFAPGAFSGTVTDRRGNVTQLVYDQRGNITSTTDPDLKTTTFTYTDPSNPDLQTTRTGPLGQTTTFEYDSRGNLTKIFVNGSFFKNWEYTYNEFSQLLTINSPGNDDASFEYDANGNMTRSVDRLGLITDYTYSPEGKMASRAVNGVTEFFTYDPATGDFASRTSSIGPTANFVFDGRGQLEEIEDAFGNSFQSVSDASRVPVSTTDPNGNTTSVTKNIDGSWTFTDLNSMTTTVHPDASGLVRSTVLPCGFVLAPTYDENDNVTGLTDPNGNSPSWTYDVLDRMASHTDTLTNTATFDYDALGRVTEIVNRNGKRRTFTWNQFNLVTAERWHDGGGAIIREFTYNYATNPLNLGRLDSITDGASTWAFSNGILRPSRIIFTYTGQSPFEIKYVWSTSDNWIPTEVQLFDTADTLQDGEIETIYVGDRPYNFKWTTPGGGQRHLRMYYDAMGRRERIDRFDVPLAVSVTTQPFARTRFTYDDNNRVSQIRHEDATGTLLFPDSLLDYVRTPGGMIDSITQPTNTATYSYDSIGQVTGVTNTAHTNESYTYDPAGNRLTSHLFAGTATIGAANRPSQVGDLALTWDAEGNLSTESNTSTGDLREFFYDHRNQLIRVDSTPNGMSTTTVAEFEYDYIGRPMNRTIAGQKTWIVHDRNLPVAEFLDGDDEFSAMYFYDPSEVDRFFGVWRNGVGERWFLNDNIESVRGVVDETAAPIAWVDYDSFGNTQGAPPAGLDAVRFAGRYWNHAATLYENRLRSYSPGLGRFIQEDPLGYSPGDLNLYRYAGNNPLTATDPFGTTAVTEIGLIVDRVIVQSVDSLLELSNCIRDILNAAADTVAGGNGGGGCVLIDTPKTFPSGPPAPGGAPPASAPPAGGGPPPAGGPPPPGGGGPPPSSGPNPSGPNPSGNPSGPFGASDGGGSGPRGGGGSGSASGSIGG